MGFGLLLNNNTHSYLTVSPGLGVQAQPSWSSAYFARLKSKCEPGWVHASGGSTRGQASSEPPQWGEASFLTLQKAEVPEA